MPSMPIDTNPRFWPPRSAYLHVPFCRHRCGYCNFTLVAGRDDLIDRFLEAVERELSWLGAPHEVETLFFGGGTPTHLAAPQLRRLIAIARAAWPLAEGAEFTVEANPLDLDRDRIAALVDGGVNRVSLGVQSFDVRWLTLLERDHRRPDIERALHVASAAFDSTSLDLIFGVPGQTLDDWQVDLHTAIAARPDHVSTYGLTIERGTAFGTRYDKGLLAPCDEEVERAMYELAIDALTAAGYEHYEVSNFARPGHRCRHNEVYWLGKTYFAAGPGAARHVDGRRETNHRSTTTYLRRVLAGASPVADSELLTPEDAARERLVFGLRRLEGIQTTDFECATGFRIDELVREPLARFVENGWLCHDGFRLRLTRAGLLVSDALWPEFLSAHAPC